MGYRYLIINDEQSTRDYIGDLIQELVPDARISKAAHGKAAAEHLASTGTDILFLDLDIPEGLRLLHMLPTRDFELVCISAGKELAVDAIRENAADYLMKPLRKAAIRDALQRAVERRSLHLSYRRSEGEGYAYLSRKVAIPHQQGIWFIPLSDIIYLKAENSYTILYTTNGQKITTSKPISRFEQALETPWFFRIHKSYIINTSQFKAYLSKNGGIAVMSNEDKLLISRYRLSRFLEVMKQIGDEVK